MSEPQPEPRPQPQPAARYGHSPCSEDQCSSVYGAACEYVDRRSRPCPTAWCPEHQFIVSDTVYCRRHAGVAAALMTLPEEEREYPDLDNRAPSLVEHVARRLHQDVVQLLQSHGAGKPGSSIVVDVMHFTMAGTPRLRGWEHRWRLIDHTGPLVSISLRVDEDTDSIVQVKVDGSVALSAEPPWTSHRREGPMSRDDPRRAAFEHELLMAMNETLQRRRDSHY